MLIHIFHICLIFFCVLLERKKQILKRIDLMFPEWTLREKKIFFGIYSSLKEDETNDVGKNLQIKKGLSLVSLFRLLFKKKKIIYLFDLICVRVFVLN